VAALKWNGWQHSAGIGGNFGPEYANIQRLTFDHPKQSHATHKVLCVNVADKKHRKLPDKVVGFS